MSDAPSPARTAGSKGDHPVFLPPASVDDLLADYGVPMPRHAVVGDPATAASAAADIGFPVALKGFNERLVHKSRAGLLALALASADDVRTCAETILARGGEGTELLVQAMATSGLELIVGGKRDPVFGPVVVIGLGGLWTEVLDDIAIRLAPVDEAGAAAMLLELRAAPVVSDGAPAGGPAHEQLCRVISRVSQLMEDRPEVAELDLNPVIVSGESVVAVDARVKVGGPRPAPRRRTPAPQAMQALVAPRSIAVVGASRDDTKQGGRLLRQLLDNGYAGDVFPINPAAASIRGLPAFASLAELPSVPDLACIVVPAPAVPDEVAACGRLGIPAAIVFASGFAEAGPDGELLTRRLSSAAGDSGLALCGPNTAGLANFARDIMATSSMSFAAQRPRAGSIALITQSGALGSSLLSRAWAQSIGFSHWICVGNEVGVTVGDYLNHLAGDPGVSAIVMFLESVRDAASFRSGAQRARAAGKPVVALKAGTSPVGRAAVRSHTAALAGDDRVYDAVFTEAGVIRVEGLQALLDVTIALSAGPPTGGPRLGVISTSGGACSLVADEAARLGLAIPELPPSVRAAVAEVIPSFGAADNPVDVTMAVTDRPEMVAAVAEILVACAEVDTVFVCLTTNADPPAARTAQSLVDAAARSAKPFVVTRIGAENLAEQALDIYRRAGMPVFTMPERAVRVAKAMADHAAVLDDGGRG